MTHREATRSVKRYMAREVDHLLRQLNPPTTATNHLTELY
jgi:hypothetical protein